MTRPHPTDAEILAWQKANIPSQSGRRVLVTGGNGFPENGASGLGYHTALGLALAGADVTIASRNAVRGDEAVRLIKEATGNTSVRFETLDLSDLSSISNFAARMREGGESLDLLVNNAGVMGRLQREVSVDGFERVFSINALGNFALSSHLLPMLKKGRDPRIVWVASSRAMRGKINFDDLNMEKVYDYAAAYDNSKLAFLIMAYEFNRRNAANAWGLTSVAAHPGVARTNLIMDGPGPDSSEGARIKNMPSFFQPAAMGALPLLYAATSPAASSGQYYGPDSMGGIRGFPELAETPAITEDRTLAEPLWAALEKMGKVRFV